MEIAYSNGSLWELFPGETACRSLTLYQRQGGVEREECGPAIHPLAGDYVVTTLCTV
jgi:hypothetical protein